MVTLRPFDKRDLDSLYAISLATGLAGGDASALYRDIRMMGHIYAAPYALLEPHAALVAEDDEGVAGYIVGAADTVAFEERLEREWWPGLRARYADPSGSPPEQWSADQRRRFMIHHPRRTPPAITAAYPAHVHVNLLPRRQGQGIGAALLDRWSAAFAVAGVHVGVNPGNQRAVRFWQAHGFERLDLSDDRTIWMGRRAVQSAGILPKERARMQRGDGGVEVRFARRSDGVVALAHLWQSDPCRVLFPQAEADEPPQAVIVTTSGGLTDGDRVRLRVEVDGGTATATTQAAEKIYRASRVAETPALIESTLRVGQDATLEWLPQETIVFDGARLRRRVEADIAADARLLACEMVVLGRVASGERFTRGAVYDGWRLRRDGRLVWVDALALDGTPPDIAGFGDAVALATGIYAAPDAAHWLEASRAVAEGGTTRAGVSVVNGVLLARFLGEPQAVRRGLMAWLAFLRHDALGGPQRLPRVWHV